MFAGSNKKSQWVQLHVLPGASFGIMWNEFAPLNGFRRNEYFIPIDA